MASWGDIAVGEWRGSWDRPGRSVVAGLLGAALGVERDDAASQRSLANDYRVGVRADAVGSPMQDYHTMQSVARSILKKRVIRTRADILAVPNYERETVLSRREYRTDVVCTVAVWALECAVWPLTAIAGALLNPVYIPFAGRRCNPLGLPMAPVVVHAESLVNAFQQRSPLPVSMLKEYPNLRPAKGWRRDVVHDKCDGFDAGFVAPMVQFVRRDVPNGRTGWLFTERIVTVGTVPRDDES